MEMLTINVNKFKITLYKWIPYVPSKNTYRTVYTRVEIPPLKTRENLEKDMEQAPVNEEISNKFSKLQETQTSLANMSKESKMNMLEDALNTKDKKEYLSVNTSVEDIPTYEPIHSHVAYVNNTILPSKKKKVEVEPSNVSSSSSSSYTAKEEGEHSTEEVKQENEEEEEEVPDLAEEDRKLVANINDGVQVVTQIIKENAKKHGIILEQTTIQLERWDMIRKNLTLFISRCGKFSFFKYAGIALSLGAMGYYVLRYQQLPLFNSLTRFLGTATTQAVASPVNISFTLPPTPTLPSLPNSTATLLEQFPLSGSIGLGLITGLLFALKLVKK